MKNVIGDIRNIIGSIHKRIKSSYGKMNGLSSCSHCGLAWNVVNGRYIPYTARLPEFSYSSMFPICVECFDKLDSDQIFNYCQEHVNRWKEFDIDMDIVMYNIKCMKIHLVDEKDVKIRSYGACSNGAAEKSKTVLEDDTLDPITMNSGKSFYVPVEKASETQGKRNVGIEECEDYGLTCFDCYNRDCRECPNFG